MVEDVLVEIERRYPQVLAAQRALDHAVTRAGGWGPQEAALAPERPLSGPAVTLPGVEVTTSIVYVEVHGLGTFSTETPILGVMVYVWGLETDGSAVELPDTESEGWARAVLGAEWSEYTYALRASAGDHQWRQGFLVLVDREQQPIPVPPDFFFSGATNGSGDIAVRPLALSANGEIATEYVAVRAGDEPPHWPVELSGEGPDEVRPAAQALLDQLRVKAAVDNRFRLLSMQLDGSAAVVGFERLDTGESLQHTIQLPRMRDLTEDSDYFRRSTPRLPFPLASPQEWAQFICGFFQEQFRTGFLGRTE